MKIRVYKIITILILNYFSVFLLLLNSSYAQEIKNEVTNNSILEDTKKEIEINEYDQEKVEKVINKASVEAKKNEEDAKQSLLETKKIIKKSNSSSIIQIAQNRVTIEQSRKDVAKLQLILIDEIKKTNDNLNNIFLELTKIEESIAQENNKIDDLNRLYYEVSDDWRTLVDHSLKIFSKKNIIEFSYNINDLLKSLSEIPKDIEDEGIAKQYQESYNSLKLEYENIFKLKLDLDSANKNYQSNLLLKAGKLRSNILQQILLLDENYIKYDDSYINDLFREIKLIPYRPTIVFYSKILEYKKISGSGFAGVLYIAKQIGLLTILIMMLIVSKNILNKLINLFSSLGQYSTRRSIESAFYKRVAFFISKANYYFKWFVLIIFLSVADVILENSLFNELNVVIPYFQYYFLYKIFQIFIHQNLSNFSYKYIEDNIYRISFNKKIRKTTKSLGVYFLSSIFLLHLTQAIVRKAYFYDLVVNLFLIGLAIILFLISFDWREDIKIAAQNRLSKKLSTIIKKLLSDKKSAFLLSFLILLLLAVKEAWNKVIFLLRSHDFFKNILSQIYRKKLESAARNLDYTEDFSSSESYKKEFLRVKDIKNFISIKNHPYEDIQNIINIWQDNKSEENSIAIYGEKGIGKSEIINKIIKDNADLNIIKTVIDKKIVNKNDLLKKISSIFEEDANKKDLFKFLSNYNKKTLIILDDCHNLFLAKEGGFEALKAFFNFLVKIDNPNLLWITTFNYYSWHYLQNSLKIGNYFRYKFKLSRWSDYNIRDLIISRHDKTNFKLKYDPLIFNINRNDFDKEFEDLQLKFFQIIWSQSKGNPNIAINLWLSSINEYKLKTIKVSLPKSAKSSQLNNLPDEHLFVYSSIAKHQNLSISEISDILLVSIEEIINIVRISLEKGYLIESPINKNRFNISYEWQIAINQLLINRNFIYAE